MLGLGLCVLLVGCENPFAQKDSISEIRTAMEEHEWLRAEVLLERFLRYEEQSDKRFEAWQNLLKIAAYNGTHPGSVLSYLETMLHEFSETKYEKNILYDLAKFHEKYDHDEQAIVMWNAYLDLSTPSDSERFFAQSRLVNLYFKSGKFIELENALDEGLSFTLPLKENVLFLYNLADLKAGLGEYEQAEFYVQQILSMDIDSLSPTLPYLHGRVLFLLGDIYEQQKKYKEALETFEKARELYPNPMVVDVRITYLKKLFKS